MFERRLYHHIDWALIVAVGAICAMGLAMIYSTTGGASSVYWTQVYALGLGAMALVLCLTFDYRSLADKSHFFYLAMVIALVGVLFFGAVRGGSRRWIDLGAFNLQPSEFAKATLALMLAKMLGEERRSALTNTDLALAVVLTLVPFLAIARQPDLGTAVTLLPILLVVAFVAGMPMRYVYTMVILAVLAAPIAYKFGLQDYQRERISTFLDPAQDPRGAGYQQIQARITVGTGGVWGKGIMEGTQGQLRFLPVAHTDFIFSAFAEEHGFVGVVVVLGMYFLLIMQIVQNAQTAPDRSGMYICMGVAALLLFHLLVNVGMVVGSMPVTGIPLPLFSYGGSNVFSLFMMLGLVNNVRLRRFAS